jgi:predicted RNA-binding Zn-ribbon protein involved in translation (DUF1610 family)
MPIRIPDDIVKVYCPECSWHVVVNRGGIGDCIAGENIAAFVNNMVGESCPKCGASGLQECPASAWEKVSPLEHLRKLHYSFFVRK